jgi:GNAT superfamily N-acetyltransferase
MRSVTQNTPAQSNDAPRHAASNSAGMMTEVEREGFLISADPARLDLDAIERLLRTSYWAADRPRDAIERSVRNSLCFGLYDLRNGRQIGFTRAVTDYATFAWLCDVIVDEAYRSRGLGKWMLETIFSDPGLASIGRWILATLDAEKLYARYGFSSLARADRWMERILSKTDC